jgi:hypothetical protein
MALEISRIYYSQEQYSQSSHYRESNPNTDPNLLLFGNWYFFNMKVVLKNLGISTFGEYPISDISGSASLYYAK